MTTTDTSPVRGELPDHIVAASFVAGPLLAGTGVFTGLVAVTQGHTWPWPPFLAIPGAALIAYGIARREGLTMTSWALIMLAGRQARRRLRFIWKMRGHAAGPGRAWTAILICLGAALGIAGTAAPHMWLMLALFGAGLVPLWAAYRRLRRSHLPHTSR
jgi:hypothetical protein